MGCWIEAGRPEIISRATRAAAKLIGKVYEHHGAGGALHIILDDWNIEDCNIDFCEEWISDPARGECTKKQMKDEYKCLEALRKLTVRERASALAIYEGYIE